MNKSICKYLVLFLVALCVFFAVPSKNTKADDFGANVFGKCGENLEWFLYGPNTLYIKGTGDMYNYSSSADVPWAYYRQSIDTIIFDGRITSIGDYAFYGFESLSSYDLSESVKKIGNYAFFGSGIQDVSLFDYSIESIGDSAFSNCYNLTSVTIPNSVKHIENSAFSFDTSLKSLILPHSDFTIGTSAFAGCTAINYCVTTTESMKYSAMKSIKQRYIHYYYDVVYTSDGNGTVEGKGYSYSGDYIEIYSVKPNNGYILDTIKLMYGNGKVVDFTFIYDIYVFDGMPDSDEPVTVIATFKKVIDIVSEPESFVGFEGDTAKFSVSASGKDLTYQWQLKKGKSWANLTSGGATTPTMTIKADKTKNGKTYRCLITDSDGVVATSKEVTITVKDPTITILTQPENYSGLANSTAKFRVAAQGEGLTYQWQLKKGSKWADLSSGGAKTSEMSIKVDSTKNGKTYRCVISDTEGCVVYSNEVTITVKEPSNAIEIINQPMDMINKEGGTVCFSVTARGDGLKYQWQLKKGSTWANLTSGGATTSQMTLKCDLSRNGKVYRCVITDVNDNMIATNEVSLTVYPDTVPAPTSNTDPNKDKTVPVSGVAEAPQVEAVEPVAETTIPAPVEAPADVPAEIPSKTVVNEVS